MINLGIIALGYWRQRHVKSARSSGRFNVTRAADLDREGGAGGEAARERERA